MEFARVYHSCALCLVFVTLEISVVSVSGNQNGVEDCEPDKVRCHDGSLCIPKAKFCDRKVDCSDQSDERFCVLGNCTDQSYFPCSHSAECVSRHFVCDGINDCMDGSDELVCDPRENCSLEHDRFLCADHKSCLLYSKVCNGHVDCWDGSDESPRCESARKSCDAGRCGEFGVCKALPYGPVCTCQQGYSMMPDNVTCKDIDECDTYQGKLCDHQCTNTNGSFDCSCLPGYRIQNTTHCRVQDPDPVLYVAANTGVLAYHIRSGRWVTMFEDQPDITALDFGPNDNLCWSTTNKTSSMVQFRYVGQLGNWTTHTLVDIGLSNPKGVAVDWMTDAVYMVSQDRGQIIACRRTSPISCVIVKEKLDNLQDIVICHHSRRMFWSSWGDVPKISSSNLDGTNTALVITDRLKHPTGLVIDWPRKTLLWADAILHRIESSSLDGSNRQIVVSRELNQPSSLAVLEGVLYWANIQHGTLKSCNWYNGCREISQFKNGLHYPKSLVIGSPSLHGLPQDQSNVLCQTASCSHVCLSCHHRYRCMCPPDQVLTQDGHTCSRTPEAKQIYISTKGQILMLPLGQPGYTPDLLLHTTLASGRTPASLEVDNSTKSVVYCDSTGTTITMATMDVLTGQVTENMLYNGDNVQHVRELTVDWVSGNIYWADVGPKAAIMVGHKSERRVLTLLTDGLDQPNSLDVDPVNGFLYFSDVGDSPFIGRCQLDGTVFTRLSIHVGHPDHLKVSLGDDQRLYFVDVHYHQIMSVSLPDGTDHWTHWQGVTGQVLGLAVVDHWIYWSDQQPDHSRLCRVHKSDHNKETCFLHNTGYVLVDLAIPSSIDLSQVDGCGDNNGGCSQFCFGPGDSVTCRCADGFILKADGRSCQAVLDLSCVFRCQDGHCLTDRSYLCDGQPDCPDGEDELTRPCDHIMTPPKAEQLPKDTACLKPNKCQHICNKTSRGPICSCHQGYQLSRDLKGCEDVNECELDNGGCSQFCTNTDGGYSCSCSHGYMKRGSLCHAKEPRPYLVIGGTGGIDKVNDQGQIEELMIGEASGFVTALDVVMETGDIIFVTSVQQALLLYKRTGRTVTTLITLEHRVTDLSYDWIGRNVYYTDAEDGILAVCSLQSVPVLCRSLRYEPVSAIVLHPIAGWLLWTSADDGTIIRMAMDGSNLTVVVEATVGQSVNSLTIDYATDRIYWISSPANQVWSSDMDGKRRRRLLSTVSGPHFSSVAAFENTLYLLDKRSKRVNLYSKAGSRRTDHIQLVSTPSCLRIVHPFQQAQLRIDVCSLKHCSHLCLVSPRRANCYCPDGFQFMQGSLKDCTDGKTTVSTTVQERLSARPTSENPHTDSPTSLKFSPGLENQGLQTETPDSSEGVPTGSGNQNLGTELPYNVKTTPRPATGTPQMVTSPSLVVNISPFKVEPPFQEQIDYSHSSMEGLCELKCANGGTCVISEDTKDQYCRCTGGYKGAICEEEDSAFQGETSTDKDQSVVVGVSVAVAITIVVIVVISVVCWIRKRSGRSFPTYMPCVTRPNKMLKLEEDGQGLVSADSSSTFGDLRFDSDVTFREFDSVSYQTTSSSTDGRGPTYPRQGLKDQDYNTRDICYCPSNQSFGSAFCRQEESQDRSSSGSSSVSSM